MPRFTPHALQQPRTDIGDTTAIEVVDAHGNLFSCKPSSGVPEMVRDQLTARGHVLRLLNAYGVSVAAVAAGVNPATGTLCGRADPRFERYAFGW